MSIDRSTIHSPDLRALFIRPRRHIDSGSSFARSLNRGMLRSVLFLLSDLLAAESFSAKILQPRVRQHDSRLLLVKRSLTHRLQRCRALCQTDARVERTCANLTLYDFFIGTLSLSLSTVNIQSGVNGLLFCFYVYRIECRSHAPRVL